VQISNELAPVATPHLQVRVNATLAVAAGMAAHAATTIAAVTPASARSRGPRPPDA
jgi:hypothetical protein